MMKTDIEIAQEAVMKPITEVAAALDITQDELELYGKYKAKLSSELWEKIKDRKDGKLVPIFFTWEDGRKYNIDRILKIERCASRKAGGVGTMYTCMIQGQESHLFYEVDKWFMERKTA